MILYIELYIVVITYCVMGSILCMQVCEIYYVTMVTKKYVIKAFERIGLTNVILKFQ